MTRTLIAAITLSITAAACQRSAAPEARPTIDPVKRGEQLVKMGGCGDCHTPMAFDPKIGAPVPQKDRMFSGHPEGAPDPASTPGQGEAVIGATFTAFRAPFGVVYAANLTPDKETGLGTWTSKDFVRAMRTGKHKGEGRAILPPMPWRNLAAQSDEDLEAIFAYLQSIPAVKNKIPDVKVPPPVLAAMEKTNAAAAAMR